MQNFTSTLKMVLQSHLLMKSICQDPSLGQTSSRDEARGYRGRLCESGLLQVQWECKIEQGHIDRHWSRQAATLDCAGVMGEAISKGVSRCCVNRWKTLEATGTHC